MRKYKAYLFDKDGTTVNTNRLGMAAWDTVVVAMLGHSIPEHDISKHFGRSFEDCAARIHEEFGTAPLDLPKLSKIYWEYYLSHLEEMDGCFPGIIDLFKTIKKDGGKIALVTSCLHDIVLKEMDHLGIASYVDVVIGADDTKKNKPDPEPAQAALKALGVEAKDAIFIGDSYNDVACGNRAGCDSCLVAWTDLQIGTLTGDQKPDFVINEAMDLVK